MNVLEMPPKNDSSTGLSLRLEFSFPETGDRKAPVDLPVDLSHLVPLPGDMVTIRSGFFRTVTSRHFCYEPEQIIVTIVCQ
jgi:hypothetical protein